MDIPSFDDFLNTLSAEEISAWVSKANSSNIVVPMPLSQDNANDAITGIMTASALTSIEMLRSYHEWLSEWLKKKSVRLL